MTGKKRTMYLRPKATNRLNNLSEARPDQVWSPQIGGYTRYEPVQKQVQKNKKSIQSRSA